MRESHPVFFLEMTRSTSSSSSISHLMFFFLNGKEGGNDCAMIDKVLATTHIPSLEKWWVCKKKEEEEMRNIRFLFNVPCRHSHSTLTIRGSLVAISYQKGSEYTREKRNTSSLLKQSRIPSLAPELVRPGAHFYFLKERKVCTCFFFSCVYYSLHFPSLSFFLSFFLFSTASRGETRAR